MQIIWTFITILVIGIVLTIQEQDIRERRQSIEFSFRIGPNDETILVIDDEDIVFLTGNNAMCVQINSTEMLIFANGLLIVFGGNIPPFAISVFHFLGETSTTLESTTVNDFRLGPGTLFLSTSRAFFTNNPVALDIIAAKATAQPLRTSVQVLTDMSEGRQISILDVDNGNFTMRLTGSPTKILDIFTNNRIIYKDNTLTVELGITESMKYENIFTFAVLLLVLGTTDTQYNVFTGQSADIVPGPGQVYVSVDENKAFYVEDFSFRTSGRDVSESINRGIFEQAFRIEETSGITQVFDSSENELITLFMDTSKFDLPNAAEVTYTGSQQLLTFRDKGGNINSFQDIQRFTIYDNNTLETFSPLSPEVTFFMCTGGTIFIDIDGSAIFVSKSNPIVISEFCALIPLLDGIDYVYSIVPDKGNNRILTVTTRDITTTPATEIQTMTIQHVTGLYTTTISQSEVVKFANNEILINNFFDMTVGYIGEVDTLFVNTENSPFRPYENESSIPFRGPGTLSYSRGNAFFTTDQTLGQDLSFEAKEAPIPIIDFEVLPIQMRIIDGIKYTENTIIQTMGGDRVITYESESYTTSEDQEILYAGNIVTVHRPMFIREGNITYIGAVETVIHMDESGIPTGLLQGVTTFYHYRGGEVRETMSPNNIIVRGPGKLYVSEDGSVALFSTSNVITPQVTDIIRQGVADFSIETDQLSSVVDDIFNISTVAATVIYPGGGVIRYSTFNDSRESLYVNDVTLANRIKRDVNVYLNFTTTDPAADQGIIRIVINGQNIYSYMPITGNNDILVRRYQSFLFNDTAITGLRKGNFTGINKLITYDGVEIKNFNSSDTPLTRPGFGLLLVQSDSDTAFFTTSRPSIEYLLDVIKNVERYIVSPRIKQSRIKSQQTKKQFAEFRIGTNVRAFAGSTITLMCNVVKGRPKPMVEFFREFENGSRILLNGTEMGIAIEGNRTTLEYSLTLSSIELNDSGTYVCIADNNIPPAAESNSTLLVREAVAPLVRPGYLPFDITPSQAIFWPSDPPSTVIFETQVVKQLVFACRVDGRPEADVVWSFNGVGIDIAIAIGLLNDTSVATEVIISGRSVLTIDVEPNQDILRGENEIECFAENAGGSTTGTVIVQGVYYVCTTSGLGDCSTTCGVGIRPIIFSCNREQGSMPPQTIASSSIPDAALPLVQFLECPVFDDLGQPVICPRVGFRWNTSEWSECTRTCGGGSRNRTVTCVRVITPLTSNFILQLDEANETEVNESMCVYDRSITRPTSRELCNEVDCPVWIAEEKYSKCSVTCGTGVQTRGVSCNIITGNYTDDYGNLQFNFTQVNDSLCDPEDQPIVSRECEEIRCIYIWLPAEFGECGDVPLPDEFPNCRQRGFFCYNDDPNPNIKDEDRVINDSFCADVNPTVSSLASCNGGRCFNGIWNALHFDECSATCGFGIYTREVQCLSPLTSTLVGEEFCDIGTKPDPVVECFVKNCRNECVRDETSLCSLYQRLDMCDSPDAMGSNGLRCCDTCLGMVEEEEDHYH